MISKGAVYFTGFVNLDLGLGFFLFFFLVRIQLLNFLHLQSTTLSINVTEKECFIPICRASWTKSD